MATNLPPFSFKANKYDQSTLSGRVKHFYEVTSPLTLLTSTETLNTSVSILNKFRKGTLLSEQKYVDMKKNDPLGFNKMLWDARSVKESIIHPDTNEPIFPPFRFSFFGPAQFIIIPLVLAPSTIASPFRTTVMHWANQSYNAGCNYANRNISSPTSMTTLMQGYTGAVASSVILALGATAVVNKAGALPKLLQSTFRIGFPFLACAVAGCTNLILVRKEELENGIQLFDENDNELGKSVLAAQNALGKCCAARFAWNAPVMIGVPMIMAGLQKAIPALFRSTRVGMATTVAVSGITCMVAVPPALALFPQYDSISVEKLEDEFHDMRDTNGKSIKRVYFNKGL